MRSTRWTLLVLLLASVSRESQVQSCALGESSTNSIWPSAVTSTRAANESTSELIGEKKNDTVATSGGPTTPKAIPTGTARLLGQSAPYTMASSGSILLKPSSVNQQQQQLMKNIVFRLAALDQAAPERASLSGTTTNNEPNSGQDGSLGLPSLKAPGGQGGVGVSGPASTGTRVNFNLARLLETLNNNNFTSQLNFSDNNNGSVNITISRNRANPMDELLLEELLIDANSNWNDSMMFADGSANSSGFSSNLNQAANADLVVKDNHHFEPSRQQPASWARSKQTIFSEIPITAPPIRRTLDVVAENYTSRKVAEEANIFAVRLLHQLNVEKLGQHNLIQAPFAVYQGISLLLAGAQGDTARELDTALLGSLSMYENTKLTHDQDRTRLMASFSEVVHQLQRATSHHLRQVPRDEAGQAVLETSEQLYAGGTAQQHLIVANNLLFSPSAYEISNEFRNILNTHFNNTALTRIETGSTESIQVVNSWIRRVTNGLVPSILDRKQTFDEFNVMALLCSSWLAQQWRDPFQRVISPLRTGIRLKGQGRSYRPYIASGPDETLLEFVDDNKRSHFVEYLRSQPTENINHFHSMLNGFWVDIVVVPFLNSNHKLVILTPLTPPNYMSQNLTQPLLNDEHLGPQPLPASNTSESPDSSLLTKLIANMANNPRKAMRSLWNTIAPEIITKKTLQHLQLARQKNLTSDETQRLESSTMPPLVQLSMPMIRIDADSSISPALNHMNIVNSFDTNQANFIGINGHPFNYYKLHLSNVIVKSTFKMNEQGINYDKTIKTLESLRIVPQKFWPQEQHKPDLSDTKEQKADLIDEVKLNKPFMYMVVDVRMRLALYTGTMRNPSQDV